MDLQKYRQNPVPMGEKNYLKSESDALVWLWSDWTEKLYKYIQRRKPYLSLIHISEPTRP